jgi:hypothetical protein
MKKFWTKWTDNIQAHKPYHIINLSFGITIILILWYAVIFSPDGGKHPIPCVYTSITAEPCASCGLSRGLSHVVRAQLPEARQVNPHSIPVFLFFLGQLLIRISTSLILLKTNISCLLLLISDTLITITSFLAAFAPMLR